MCSDVVVVCLCVCVCVCVCAWKPPGILVEDALKLKYLEGSTTPLFRSRGTGVLGIQA